MRKLALLVCALVLSAQFALAQKVAPNSAFERGPYQIKYRPAKPWESKALTPVNMELRKGGEALVIADKGTAALPIVIPDMKDRYYRQIAGVLKEYLDKATGADFKIVGGKGHANGIFLGPCDHPEVQRIVKTLEKKKPEHFMVYTFDGGIALMGRDLDDLYGAPRGKMSMNDRRQSRGTLFAVVDFIERFVGVRFYMPTEYGTVIPYWNDTVLSVPPVTYSDGPTFKHRGSSYGNYATKDAKLMKFTRKEGLEWVTLLRRANVYRNKASHTDRLWHKRYAKTHPEYFALRADGTRSIGTRGKQSSQRCYSDEGGFQQHLGLIEEYDKTGDKAMGFTGPLGQLPNKKYIYWWPNDGFKGCACKPCMKLTDVDALPDRKHSRLIYWYTAKLANAIKKRWPGKVLIASSYSTWYHIPEKTVLPDNVKLTVCWSHVPEPFFKEKRYWDWIQADTALKTKQSCQPLVIWSHYPHTPRIKNRLDTPYMAPHILARVLRTYRDKLDGIYLNGNENSIWSMDGYIVYIYHKMLWNPDLDVDAVLAEYCDQLFGPAGKVIKAYHDACIDRWENTKWKELPEGYNWTTSRVKWSSYYKETYPRAWRMKMQSLLAKALPLTEKGSAYYERTNFFLKSNSRFFTQGDYLDRGQQVVGDSILRTPKVDGNLDEWPKSEALILRDNTNGKKVAIRTEFYTSYDKENFYVAGRAEEPEAIKGPGGNKPRDFPLWNYDSVEIFLCTEQPGLKEAGLSMADQYHQIILGPDGGVFDSYKPMGKKSDRKVTLDFTHVVKKDAKGYSFEIAIPYKTLNAIVPKPGAHWFVNFYRNRRRGKEYKGPQFFAWSPTLSSAHDTSRYAKLMFPTKVLWKAKLGPIADHWRIEKKDADIAVTPSIKDGKMVIRVKAGPGLKKREEVRFTYRSPKAKFTKPVALEWKFKFNGPGMNRARTYLHCKQTKSRQDYYYYSAKGSKSSSGWVVGIADKPKDPKAGLPKGVDYYCFALLTNPGADYTFEVDYIKIHEKQ
jgi:Domain of unknown function (DUF4838)/Carbohydrate family 9 binding domain-like